MADEDLFPNSERIKKIVDNPEFQQRQSERPLPKITNRQEAIDWLNKSYATIILNGKFKILHEKPNGDIEFMDKKDLMNDLDHMRLLITSEDGKPKSTPITEFWFKSADRRRYDGIVFNPERKGHYDNVYNLWDGWRIAGVVGDCQNFLDFIKSVICAGDEDNYTYLVALIAQMFQRPWDKPGVAVVIRGDEGVGKSFFIEKLSALTYPYYFKTSNPDNVFGDHNGQLKSVILLHLEEAVWAGSKKDESLLKDLITGRTIQINDKFVPVYSVANHLHLFISGNPEWLVAAGHHARRIFALHADDSHRRDTTFFAELDNWFKEAGAGALMHYFMNYDYSAIDLRIVPVTDELIVQKGHSQSPVAEWLHSIVDSLEFPYGELVNGKVQVIKAILLNDYNHSPMGKRHQLSPRKFGNQLVELLPELVVDNIKLKDSRDVRRNGYECPEPDVVRKSMEARVGGKIKWSTPIGQWSVLRGNTDFDFSLYKPDM